MLLFDGLRVYSIIIFHYVRKDMNRIQFEYHPIVGYKFIADLRSRIQHEGGGYFVKTNNLGFRSDTNFQEGKAGKKRILVFGDSFTAGDGVSNKFRYTDLLEKACDCEVYNFGLPGSGTDQQYLLYKEYAPKFDHDLLIISVLVENIRRVNAQYRYYLGAEGEMKVWMKPYFQIVGNQLHLQNTPVEPKPINVSDLPEGEKGAIDSGGPFELLRTIVKKLGLKEQVQKLIRFQPVPEYSSSRKPEWQLMKKILEQWVSESKVPVLLIPIPLYQHIEETASASSYQRRFSELKSICHLHDPLPDLRRYELKSRRSFRFERDIHLTPEGHRALFESILPVVKKILEKDAI
jgi:carbamoyltransferase